MIAPSVFLVIAIFVQSPVFAAVVPSEEPNSPGEPCQDMGLLNCFLPFVAFAMSEEAQQFMPSHARADGTITEAQFRRLCDLSQPAAACLSTHVAQCVPKNYTDIHVIAKGTVKLLQFCQEPNGYSKAMKLAKCAHRMDAVHRRCGKSMESSVPKNIDIGNPAQALRRDNALQEVCCNVKQYETCFLPEVTGLCSADDSVTHTEFLNRIYNAYGCQSKFPTCPVRG